VAAGDKYTVQNDPPDPFVLGSGSFTASATVDVDYGS